MVLLGVLGHVGHVICEIDTGGDNARDIPKNDLEPLLTHFRGIEEARGKHQQIRVIQVCFIGHIGRYRDVLRNANGFTALRRLPGGALLRS